jgi:hypothetical protein
MDQKYGSQKAEIWILEDIVRNMDLLTMFTFVCAKESDQGFVCADTTAPRKSRHAAFLNICGNERWTVGAFCALECKRL